MRDLDTPEIHGYEPNFGYRVYTEKAIEMVARIGWAAVQRPPLRGQHGRAGPAENVEEKAGEEAAGTIALGASPRSVRMSCSASSNPATQCEPSQSPSADVRGFFRAGS